METIASRVAGGTRTHLQRIEARFDYPVAFARGVLDPANPVLVDAIARREPGRRHRACFVVDQGVAQADPGLCARAVNYAAAHAQSLDCVAPPEVVPGGEAAKNDPALVQRLLAFFHGLGLDRQSVVVAVGGGAVLDLVGYAAALTHRGLRLVRLPTTVMAQCDSGVGVKNAVNAFGVKNFLGTFAPPFAVVNDLDFLHTLTPRDRVAGMAEAVKVALLKDPVFFDWLESRAPALVRGEADDLAAFVERSAVLHLAHIAGGDPFELGTARPLDYGHWAAHKLESLSDYRLRHGEAVALGMLLDGRYAVEAGLLPEPEFLRLDGVLAALGLPRWDEAFELADAAGRSRVLEGLEEFRQHLGGEASITLLAGIGRSVEAREVHESLVLRALEWLRPCRLHADVQDHRRGRTRT